MTLFPRSLLWRTVLLIALLTMAGHFVWLQIVQITERGPRARLIAQQIASVVNLTRSALITADPARRIELLRDLSQQEGIQVFVGGTDEAVEPLPDYPIMPLIEAEVRQHLGADTRLAARRGGIEGTWVSFKIDDEEYWVMLPRERIQRLDQLRWAGWAAVVLLFSFAGAYFIVARINRPLRELTRAAAAIGRGQTPAPVSEIGPLEIQTLAHAFNQMSSDLKRIDEDRALLLAGVSHDLRTPLSRIRLSVEMLDDKADATLKEGLVQDIEDIDAVISQFLDFARMTGEQGTASETDLNELVNSVSARYQRQGKTVVTRSGTVPLLNVKALAIQRLLTNLIDNALHHGGTGAEVETAAENGRARLSVLDRGPGIPEAEAERMLQPFTRLDTARSTTSSGLGLAIVDRIARMHGGSVKLLARPGGGLEARVEFPLAPAKN